jgi:hypothetical protein
MILNLSPLFILAGALLQVPPERTMGYMILGYAVMWIIGLVYVISLVNRQRNLQQDVQLMRRLLEDDERAEQG